MLEEQKKKEITKIYYPVPIGEYTDNDLAPFFMDSAGALLVSGIRLFPKGATIMVIPIREEGR